MKNVPAGLDSMYVRVEEDALTAGVRNVLHSGVKAVTGNTIDIDIGENGTVGNGAIISADNYTSGGAAFKSFSGYSLIEAGEEPPTDILISGNYLKAQAFGDSITANGGGRGIDGGWTLNTRAWWADALTKSTQSFYLSDSKGVTGNTTLDLLARISDVLNDDADIIILMIGINDLGQGRTISDIKASMIDIVDQIITAGKFVFVVPVLQTQGTTELQDNITALNLEYRDIASTRDKMVVCSDVSDFNTIMLTPSYTDIAPDGLHPANRGAELISDHVALELDKYVISTNQNDVDYMAVDFTGGSDGSILNGATGTIPTGWRGYYADPSEAGTFTDRGVGYTADPANNAITFKGGTTTETNRIFIRTITPTETLNGLYRVECDIEITSDLVDLSYFRVYTADSTITNGDASVARSLSVPDDTTGLIRKTFKWVTPYFRVNNTAINDYIFIRLESQTANPIQGKVSNPRLIKYEEV